MAGAGRDILSLPSELLFHICSLISSVDLSRLSCTCKLLHAIATDDKIWHAHIQDNLPSPITRLPESCRSYRDLYTSLYPAWYLARHQLWFSDSEYHGKLILARYDARLGRIEAYTMVAELPRHHLRIEPITWHDGKNIASVPFHPIVKLDYNQPVLSLECGDIKDSLEQNGSPSEVDMKRPAIDRVKCTFCFARALPEQHRGPNTAVWPPLTLPALERTRNVSSDHFKSKGHQPVVPSGICESTFRIRQKILFSTSFNPIPPFHLFPSSRVGPENVKTWGTLSKECYTPTAEKPWRGIWCGDYSAHGCEFLVVLQPDDPPPLSSKARQATMIWPRSRASFLGNSIVWEDDDELEEYIDPSQEVAPTSMHAVRRVLSRSIQGNSEPRECEDHVDDVAPYKGRLEAIKLTGDTNIPRGEVTFIADDIGQRGLVGYTQDPKIIESDSSRLDGVDRPQNSTAEPGSRGARIVKSIGHIADRDFTGDGYIPSQLVLISENRLAQYWMQFGHVSFYQRVDMDKLLQE